MERLNPEASVPRTKQLTLERQGVITVEQQASLAQIDATLSDLFTRMDADKAKAHAPLVSTWDKGQFDVQPKEPRQG